MQHHALPNALLLGLTTAVALAPNAVGGDTSFEFRKVALSGEAAPGTANGIVFGALTTALNHDIMVPRIDDAGAVAFIGFVTGPDVQEGNQTGIWKLDETGTLVLVVRTGEPAPGTEAGVVFAGVPSEYLPFPPSFGGGLVQFQGELTGPGIEFANRFGVWREGPGGLTLVTRSGDTAPALPGFTTSGQPSGVIDGLGTTLLMSEINGPGVTVDSNEVRWSDRTGEMAVLLREGDPAPGIDPGVAIGRGNTGYTFPAMALSGDGFLLQAANLLGAGVNTFNDEGLFVQDRETGQMTLLAREGDPAPGLDPGVTFGGNSVVVNFRFLNLNRHGQYAFKARLGGAVETTTAMFSNRTGELLPVMQPGAPLPGSVFGFGLFGQPIVNDAGRIAFAHAAEDEFFPPFGIWWEDDDGEIVPAVLPGQSPENLPGAALNGAALVGFNTAGQLAFSGSVDDETGWHSGVFLVDADGTFNAIALTGFDFDVHGDDSDIREVLRVAAGGLSESGHVAFRLDFTDGTSGHFTAERSGDEIACAADVDGSGDVGVDDLTAVILAWSTADDAADVNDDGIVDVIDLVAVISGWGACP